MNIKIEIKNRWTWKVLFELETENNTIKKTLLAAIKAGSDLRGSNLSGSDLRDSDLSGSDLSDSNLRDSDLSGSYLRGSDLSGSDLSGSDLSSSDLSGSDLRGSNLRGSNLRGSDLRDSDLRGSDLSGSDLRGSDLRGSDLSGSDLSGSDLSGSDLIPIKNDFFIVLLHSMHEIEFLKESIINGRIDGSTYKGDCACLSGTTYKAAIKNNGPQQIEREKSIMSCRDSSRPIERFFLGINKGDTPENSQFSKLALAWLIEFQDFFK